MNSKDPRDKQDARAKQEETYTEPTARGGREETASESDEDARVESFESPGEKDYTEDAASIEVQSTPGGIPQNLLEIKKMVESGLTANYTAAAVRAEDASGGTSNIVGVGFGLGEPHSTSGTPSLSTDIPPGEFALNVYVTELTSIDAVKAVLVESMGISAASDDSLPLNIFQTGLVEAQPNTLRVRPAPGGFSVAHYKVTAGTIGCLCVGNSPPRNARRMILSNNHVLANSNNAVFNDCICQPGPADGGKCPADQIAVLERFVPINFSGGNNYVDCATGWTWPDRVRRELAYRSGSGIVYFRIGSTPGAPALGMIVGKTGRTTQLRVGRVTGIGVTINVNYGGGKIAKFVDQIAIQSVNTSPFSAGGDSGSSIWTYDSLRRPIGLLFAGGGGVTFANRMTRVVAALDVHLYT